MLSREVKERLREYETPFYLYDMELLRRTVECALREADRYGYRLHYAMKANNDRRIMGNGTPKGDITLVNTFQREAPMSRAASSNEGSMFFSRPFSII